MQINKNSVEENANKKILKETSQEKKETLLDWLNYMQGIHISAIDMGLSRVLPVAEHLNLPHSAKDSQVFTVAGTNGKGSTTAAIAEICKQAGYKTAIYQSPHLLEFNERVKINGTPVDDDTLILAFEQVEKARLFCDLSLSFFEMTTLAAMLIFAQADCDVWVLEIGLGGRLDVVNIIDPNVTVITNIGIDHVDWLGDDREKIGYEKAGILREGVPLIYGESYVGIVDDTESSANNAMPKSVQARIEELGIDCYQMGRDFSYLAPNSQLKNSQSNALSLNSWKYSNASTTLYLPVSKLSLHNVANAISAVLVSSLTVSHQHIAQAMNQVSLAGRFDYQEKQERRWLFDVGHNEHGVQFLLQQFNQALPRLLQSGSNAKGRLVVVFSMLQDKDIKAVLSLLTDRKKLDAGELDNKLLDTRRLNCNISHWYLAPIDPTYVPRSASLSYLHSHVSDFVLGSELSKYDSLQQATQSAIADTTEDDLILVCGSFHTISEVLQALET